MPAGLIRIATFADAMFAQNTRVFYQQDLGPCWIIDPGFPPATANALNYVSRHELTIVAVVLTHAHSDHIAGLPAVLASYPGVPVHLAASEWAFLGDPAQNLSTMAGMQVRVNVDRQQLHDMVEDQAMELGGTRWRVLDTSGHSPGGRTLYSPEQAAALVGDALFAGSIGRVDFPHSDGALLLSNIRTKLLTLPGETVVYSGHGPDTTIATEQETNPFLV